MQDCVRASPLSCGSSQVPGRILKLTGWYEKCEYGVKFKRLQPNTCVSTLRLSSILSITSELLHSSSLASAASTRDRPTPRFLRSSPTPPAHPKVPLLHPPLPLRPSRHPSPTLIVSRPTPFHSSSPPSSSLPLQLPALPPSIPKRWHVWVIGHPRFGYGPSRWRRRG